jgi:hypothetical protein
LNDYAVISVPYDNHWSLLIEEAMFDPEPEPKVNISILEDSNQNITAGQKLLLEWHYIWCDLNFQSLQYVLRRAPFVVKRFAAAVKCDAPKCENCELAKSKRRPKNALTHTRNTERDGALKADRLSPGLRVSVDHFQCRQRGRTCASYGKASSKQ